MQHFKLKKIVTGKFEKFIETNDGCFVCSDNEGKKYSLLDTYFTVNITSGVFLDPIYPCSGFVAESYFKNPRIDPYTYSDSDFNETSAVNNNYMSITQGNGDVCFGIIDKTENNIIYTGYNNDQSLSALSVYLPTNALSYLHALSSLTCSVSTNNTLALVGTNVAISGTSAFFESLSGNDNILSGFKYSYLSELPLDLNYYDYDNAVMYSQVIKLKDFYSADFDMKYNQNTGVMSEVRKYKKVGSNNNDIWISYKANKTLNATSKVLSDGSDLTSSIYVYDFIDRVKQLNRSKSAFMHKSNIFSIRITDSGLNDGITDQTIRNKIQKFVENVIRQTVNKVKPADCEVWKVEFSGY